jgi:hypothetical protein
MNLRQTKIVCTNDPFPDRIHGIECRFEKKLRPQEDPLLQNVRYYSIVAFTKRESVQPGLLFTYDFLRNIDPRNDGQVIFYDQIIPGASPLGYINLDHWAIAVPVKEKMASAGWLPHPTILMSEACSLKR